MARTRQPAKPKPPIDRSGSGSTTLVTLLADYAEEGFDSSFSVLPGSRLECLSCRQLSPAAMVTMTSLRRMEGASDPADMAAVLAVTCPACGERGTLVLGFGPAATADAEVLRDLHDERDNDVMPAAPLPAKDAVGRTPHRDR